MEERYADAGLATGVILLVILGLGTSVIASLFHFSLIHDALQALAVDSLSVSGLDSLMSSATGGILDFATLASVFFIVADIAWLVWLARNWK